MNINEFLKKRLHCSYEDAFSYIVDKRIMINHIPAIQKQEISNEDTIQFDELILQKAPEYKYIAYHKPVGVECTNNPSIDNNLPSVLPEARGLFPVGRLDKASEGLLLLTNDGKLYQRIAMSEVCQEKEYIVQVDKKLSDEALEFLSSEMDILGRMVKAKSVKRISENTFNIILVQGLNRQIRRMCHKAGYHVIALKRIRIKSLLLGDLKYGEFKYVSREEVEGLS